MRSIVSSLFPVGNGALSGTVEDTRMDSRSDYIHHRARGRPKGKIHYVLFLPYLMLFSQDPTSNPYGLGDGIKYYMLEVEDWTQSSQINKRRPNLRKVSAVSDPESERKSTLATPERSPIPPGPPQAQVEDSFSATQPPTSHLFPARPRANSTPSAGPSSLSRLLAQASLEPSEESTSVVVPPSKAEVPTSPPSSGPEPSPSPQPQPPPSSPSLSLKGVPVPSPPLVPLSAGSATSQPRTSSPLRPGSRASWLSTTSRISWAQPGEDYEFTSCSGSCGDDSVDGTHVFRGPVIV